MSWQSLTTRRGNKPKFAGGAVVVPKPAPRKLNKRQVRQVDRKIKSHIEKKFFPLAATDAVQLGSEVINDLTIPSQGLTDILRVGDRIELISLYFRGVTQIGDSTNIVRIIIFQWKPATAPVAANLLLTGPSGGIDPHSHYNHDTRQMYRILKDKTFQMEGFGSGAGDPVTTHTQRVFNWIIKPKIKNVQYNAGTAVGTNKIFSLFIADSAITPNPNVRWNSKLMFLDG